MSTVNTAPIKWAQRSDSLYITIALPGKICAINYVAHVCVSTAAALAWPRELLSVERYCASGAHLHFRLTHFSR